MRGEKMNQKYLFVNVNIADNKLNNSILVEDGIIKEIKKGIQLKNTVGEDTKIIDLNNRFLIPSFTDAHLHYFYYALKKESIDLKNCKSISEVYNKIKSKTDQLDSKHWVTVINWDEEKYPDCELMNRHFLDKISKNVPIIVKRRCLHLAYVNSKALKIAKINKKSSNPVGGKILRDKDGIPTGVLQDESITRFDDIILNNYKERFKNMLEDNFKDFLKYGITTIHTDDFWQKKYREQILKSYIELARKDKLPIDIILQLRVNNIDDFNFHLKVKDMVKGLKRLNAGPVKFMLDGSLGGRTAALRKPYTDQTDTKGELLYKKEELENLIDQAYKLNFQPAVHAIGIKAVELIVKIYEKINKKYPDKHLRPIIVHASMLDDKLIKKIKTNNIVLSIQPTFISSDYKMADKRLGKRRVKYLYKMRSLIEKGLHLAAGSDAPVEEINPLLGIYAAVKRNSHLNKNEPSWQPNEIIDLKTALELYNKRASYQNFEEKTKGKIEKGYKADFITFNKNLYHVNIENLINLKVKNLIKDGNLIY